MNELTIYVTFSILHKAEGNHVWCDGLRQASDRLRHHPVFRDKTLNLEISRV